MRAVRWVHISDLHMRPAENTQRHAVLSAMLEDMRRRVASEGPFDFVVVTGDLAFSGQESEYELVGEFLDQLVGSIEVAPGLIFCVPGNHDVDRDRSKMCFTGARETLRNQNEVYGFLRDDDERASLLLRQESYRAFDAAFADGQEKEYTDDRLGYVSMVEVEDLRIALMGLNSSWLAEGGADDEGKLLIGESQVQGAIGIAKGYSPHVVIGLQHHPFELLQRFDQRAVRHRMEEACHFVHCGHLHDPEVRDVVAGSGRCITVMAGASFESRVARNTYTTMELDPVSGEARVTFVQYNPQTSSYEYVSHKNVDYAIDGPCHCTVAELAEAIDAYCSEARGFSGYLAKLLLGFASDVPMMLEERVEFGNWEWIAAFGDASLLYEAEKFKGVGRAVRLLHGQRPLREILAVHGDPIGAFARRLERLAEGRPDVKEYMRMQHEARARPHAGGRGEPLRHTVDLLADLVRMDAWDRARELAERTLDVSDGAVKAEVRRVLALCLARSSEERDKARAAELYREGLESEEAKAGDCAALAVLTVELERYDEAKEVVEQGMDRFPEHSRRLAEIGMRIVEATGDRGFRDWLASEAQENEGE